MAYSESAGDNARLLLRTITGVTDFSGRSRRTEVIYYWIASALAGVIIDFPVGSLLPVAEARLFSNGLQLLFLIPMFALFVRRVHDQDRSGWWGLLLPIFVALSIPRVLAAYGSPQAVVSHQMTPLVLTAISIQIAIVVLFLLPGSDGPNRFGPDPRLEQP